MNFPPSSLNGLRPNPEWAKLTIFDRKGWKRVRLAEVVENVNETESDPVGAGLERFIGLEHLEPGSLHVRSWGNTTDGTTFTRRCRPGQVLFGKRRAYQRKVAKAEFDAVVSGDIYVFQAKKDKLLPELLPFLCMSEPFFQHAVDTSAGSLSPRTNWDSVADFEFDLPPIEQQRRIAEILWAAEVAKENFHSLLIGESEFRKAVHRGVFDGGLAELSKATKGNSALPRGWRRSTVGEACIIENQLRKPISAEERATIRGPYPYYGPTGVIDYIDEYRVDGEYVLIGEDGDHFLKFHEWNMTQLVRGRFNVNNHAHLIRGTDSCRTEWIFQYYKHRNISPFLSRQGAGRLKLQKAVLEKMPIVIPPLNEQDVILDFLNNIDRNIGLVTVHIESIGKILNKLMTNIMR